LGFWQTQARIRWFLSINYDLIPEEISAKGQRTYRSITVDGKEVEFSEGFFDLHTKSYQHILEGKGFGLQDAMTSVQIVHDIRNATLSPIQGDFHPLVKHKLSRHPFNGNQ